jgi:hypothetical protein
VVLWMRVPEPPATLDVTVVVPEEQRTHNWEGQVLPVTCERAGDARPEVVPLAQHHLVSVAHAVAEGME